MNQELPEFSTLPPEASSQGGSTKEPLYEKVVSRDSHVAGGVVSADGHNYDPKLRKQWSAEPGVVHATRQVEPASFSISDGMQKKHEAAKRDYPHLNLTDGEHVIADIQRHFIGLVGPIAAGSFIAIILLSVLLTYPDFLANQPSTTGLPSFGVMSLVITPLVALVGLFSYIAVWVYLRNRFYLTNESVIQEIQLSLFSRREQTASLGSIEDVSYHQRGFIQTLFNYGSIRLSTEGDETTYRYYYVLNPRAQVKALTNAVEDFKNGRPVGD